MTWFQRWQEQRQQRRLTKKLNEALGLIWMLEAYGYDNACQGIITPDGKVEAFFYVNSGEDAHLMDQVLELCSEAYKVHSDETREKLGRLFDQIAELQRINNDDQTEALVP